MGLDLGSRRLASRNGSPAARGCTTCISSGCWLSLPPAVVVRLYPPVQRRLVLLARGNPSAVQPARARFTSRPRLGLGTVWGSKGHSGVSLDDEVGGYSPCGHARRFPPLRDPILPPPPLSASLATGPRAAASPSTASYIRGGWTRP